MTFTRLIQDFCFKTTIFPINNTVPVSAAVESSFEGMRRCRIAPTAINIVGIDIPYPPRLPYPTHQSIPIYRIYTAVFPIHSPKPLSSLTIYRAVHLSTSSTVPLPTISHPSYRTSQRLSIHQTGQDEGRGRPAVQQRRVRRSSDGYAVQTLQIGEFRNNKMISTRQFRATKYH